MENPQKNMPSVHQLWGLVANFPMIRFRDEEDQFLLRSDLSLHTFTEWQLGQRKSQCWPFWVIRVGHSTQMTLALEGMFCWSNLRNLAEELAMGLISMLYVFIYIYKYIHVQNSHMTYVYLYILYVYMITAQCVYIYIYDDEDIELYYLYLYIERERASPAQFQSFAKAIRPQFLGRGNSGRNPRKVG